jgi:hypothetical protein
VNLNFEQATVPPGSQLTLPAALAFPGWTPRLGEVVLNNVYYNNDGIGEAAVGLYDQPRTNIGLPVFEGRYSTELITGFGTNTRASLAQLGDIPSDSRSIRLLSTRALGPPEVYIGGVPVPLVLLVSAPSTQPSLYGGDVTAFAGTGAELRLVSGPPQTGGINGVDAIEFSAIPIPEPICLVLAVGTLVPLIRSRRPRLVPICEGDADGKVKKR